MRVYGQALLVSTLLCYLGIKNKGNHHSQSERRVRPDSGLLTPALALGIMVSQSIILIPYAGYDFSQLIQLWLSGSPWQLSSKVCVRVWWCAQKWDVLKSGVVIIWGNFGWWVGSRVTPISDIFPIRVHIITPTIHTQISHPQLTHKYYRTHNSRINITHQQPTHKYYANNSHTKL